MRPLENKNQYNFQSLPIPSECWLYLQTVIGVLNSNALHKALINIVANCAERKLQLNIKYLIIVCLSYGEGCTTNKSSSKNGLRQANGR